MKAAILFIVVWNLCSELVAINILRYEDDISGQITSPGFPRNYPNNVNYTWIIRTGSHPANVAFRIIEMSIKKWRPCDDYLEITEIEPCCFRIFKRCGHLNNYNFQGFGKKIRVSFISDKSLTEKGFHLTWKGSLLTLTLPPTKALPMQIMLATTTKYKVRTTSKKMDVKTTALELETTTPTSSQESVAYNILQYKDGISGQITSPGYPLNYPNNVNYTWIIRTGSLSANVTFKIIEMNIGGRWYCNDYLEISEIEPCCVRLFKLCGHLKNYNLYGGGKKIRVSFISDESITEKGFHLTWNVANSTVQAKIISTPRTTESTKEDTSMLKKISSITFTTLIPEFPSTAENSGGTTSLLTTSSSEQPLSLSKEYLKTKRTTLQTRSQPLTLSSTTRSSSVKLTTLVFNATTAKEDKNTFDIQTVFCLSWDPQQPPSSCRLHCQPNSITCGNKIWRSPNCHRVGSRRTTINLFQSYHSNCFSAVWN